MRYPLHLVDPLSGAVRRGDQVAQLVVGGAPQPQ
jgi:hypothetical protein